MSPIELLWTAKNTKFWHQNTLIHILLMQCWKFWHPPCRWVIIDTKMMARLIGRWRIWQLKARDLRDSSEQPTYHCLSSLSIWTYPPLSVIIVCRRTTDHHCTSEFVPSFFIWSAHHCLSFIIVCHHPDQYHWCCHPVYICCSNLQFIILFRQPLSALELPHHILPSFRKKALRALNTSMP